MKRVTLAVSDVPLRGVTVIKPLPLPQLPPSMQRHADLQICPLGEGVAVVCPEAFSYYKRELTPYGITVLCGKTNIGSTYPQDVAYNIARVGNIAIHNTAYTDPVAAAYFREHGISVLHVRQGYTKCAVLPIDENTMITADSGIANAARARGITVLQIAPGGVRLDGFPYGFVGGCGGMLSERELFVTGSLADHPSHKKIADFLHMHAIALTVGIGDVPIDIGSVLPLKTEV